MDDSKTIMKINGFKAKMVIFSGSVSNMVFFSSLLATYRNVRIYKQGNIFTVSENVE